MQTRPRFAILIAHMGDRRKRAAWLRDKRGAEVLRIPTLSELSSRLLVAGPGVHPGRLHVHALEVEHGDQAGTNKMRSLIRVNLCIGAVRDPVALGPQVQQAFKEEHRQRSNSRG